MSTKPLIPKDVDLQAQATSFANDSFAWIRVHWLDIIIAAAVAAVVIIVLHAIRRWALKLCQRGNGVSNWPAIIGRAVGKTGNFFILMAALRLVIGYANAPALVNQTVVFLFTIAAVFQAAIWLREVIFGAIEHRMMEEGDAGIAYATAFGIIRLLVTIVLFSIATVMVLGNLGVNVTGLIAGLGVGGIAIGLAAQGIFADLFAALAILFDKPFRIGDTILYGSSKGRVEKIGLKSTRLRGPNGEQRIIANKKLLDYELINSSNREYRRMTLTIRLAYKTPGEKAAKVPEIVKAAVESEHCVFGKAWFVDFAQSSMNFEAEFDSPSPSGDEADAAKHRVAMAILKGFDAEGIDFFAPTQAPGAGGSSASED